MKKIFSILFVAVLAFGMASCGKSKEEQKSIEETAVDEFVTLCNKIVDAADAGDVDEIIDLYNEFETISEKYEKMEEDGDLTFSDQQQKRILRAAKKAQRAMMNIDVYVNDSDFSLDSYYESDEEKAVEEIEAICNKIIIAAANEDYDEILSLSGEMMKLGTEIDKKEQSGELNFTDEQMERVQNALNKIEQLDFAQ